MKAVKIYQAGGPEQLIYQDVPTPDIKEGWSLVKIKGFGINHSEIFTREGKSPSVQFPRILGIECVGEVAQSSTPALAVGQKVVSIMGEMGRAFDGSYAEYVLLPNEQIYPVHTDLDWTTLAAIPETYYTAFGSLQQLRIAPQDRVLVRGAGSGVGVAFAQLLKAQFPHVVLHGSTRNPAKATRLQAVGFDEVITEADGKIQTDQSYDKILELVGPATLRDSFSHINEHGIVCNTGQLGNIWYVNDFDPIIELKNNSYLTAFYSGNVSQAKLDAMFDYIRQFNVKIFIERVFALEQVPEAHRFLQSADGFGKVVVMNE
ncbi:MULTISPECIES: zinc-binding alcohol dehydrogenase family protein [Eikenella]|mgnify:FL=1|uniref:Quinone oxidoreductase n=1 Tax=Eikenella corrodens TaxID=539 RepID=A0A1A9RIU6_EIKCO|nr:MULTISPECIES: zinc-binding alcohol dehydrogenase family protein [Eikenella]MDU4301851.1 zinc-binding alcohol dehydrogenase family protein [Eikenella corrodens]OAM18652.1 quinone oxidoreductase [Eikenella corrodens]OAM32396.1 quinone oxidoreductase [Eikenella corrodens]OFN60101.1 quinone oxidoreductase [Eikenella sp. HMSC061C02]OWP27783.1 quinone oxidoreductase [Eikenella corrodens]